MTDNVGEWEDVPKTTGAWETTPAGAVTGKLIPRTQTTTFYPPKKPQERVTEVAGATGLGAALGAASPEILKGLSYPARAIPYVGPALGAGLSTAGQLLARQRISAGLTGGVSGAAGSTAGQLAEMSGVSPGAKALSEFAGGALIPQVPATLLGFPKVVRAGTEIVKGIRGMEEVPLSQREATRTAVKELRGKPVSELPAREIYTQVEQGVSKELDEARRQASDLLNQANAQAQQLRTTNQAAASKVMNDAQLEAVRILEEGANRWKALQQVSGQRGALASRAQTEIEAGINKVGNPNMQPTDVGMKLRQQIAEEQKTLVSARRKQFKENELARDAVVKQKESAGEYLHTMPEYESYVNQLREKLLIGQTAQQQKLAPVTEAGLGRSYQNLYDSITGVRKQVGVNEAGNPVYKTFPPSFEAIDAVRRKMGDIAFGKQIEGYEGLTAEVAADAYKKLSKIEMKFAGDVQSKLIKDYEQASSLIEKYKTDAGKKAIDTYLFDEERYKVDPASLVSTYFKTKSSVNDLIELTGGNTKLVTEAASDYAARELANKSAAKAKAWSQSNSDWLTSMPEINKKVKDYVSRLEQLERVQKTAAGRAEELGKEAVKARTTAKEQAEKLPISATKEQKKIFERGEKEAAGVVSEAGKEAEKVISTAQKKADEILRSETPTKLIERLLTGPDPVGDWRSVSKYLSQTPKGQDIIVQAVRQSISEVSPGKIESVWKRNVRPALEGSNILPANQIQDLETKVMAVVNASVPEQQKLGLFKKLILQGLGGVSAAELSSALRPTFMGDTSATR